MHILIAALVIVLVLLFVFHYTSAKSQPIVYGSMGCPHTVTHRKNVGSHEFVDCTSQPCPDFVEGFPTTKYPDGSIVVGATPK